MSAAVSAYEHVPETAVVDDHAEWILPSLLVLLVMSFLVPGLVPAVGLPDRLTLVTDAATAVIALLAMAAIVHRRVSVSVPLPFVIYVAFALAAFAYAVIDASTPWQQAGVALKNLLVWPVLAVSAARLLPSGDGTPRSVLLVVLALCGLEFVIGAFQWVIIGSRPEPLDTDSLTATLESSANWAVALVVLTGTCLAFALSFTRRPRALWLAIALVLPLFVAWAVVKGVALIFPFCALAVIGGAAYFARPRRWRHLLGGAVGVIAVTIAIFGSYSIWYPDSYSTIVDSRARSHYLDTGDLSIDRKNPSQAAARSATPGRGTQIKDTWNLVSGSPEHLLFGRGLGAASYSAGLGVSEPSEQFETATYIDGNTMLAETGFVGLAVVGAFALALLSMALAAVRVAPIGSWSFALSLAYLGILVVIGLGAIYATPFRESALSAAFWIITAVVMQPFVRAPGRLRWSATIPLGVDHHRTR